MKTFAFLTVLFFTASIYPQMFKVSGVVKDNENRILTGVNVYTDGGKTGTSSDSKGVYILENLSPGEHIIHFSIVGYITETRKIRLEKDVHLDITLEAKIITTEQVVVSAAKYRQKLSDLHVSASIVEGKDILKYNNSNMRDALKNVSGVNLIGHQLSIRGSSGYSKGVGARVLMTVDGFPFITADAGEIKWETIPVEQVERIEIIKGASSSLYGSTAIGGVINVITRETVQPGTYISSYIGAYEEPTYDTWNWSGENRMFNGQTISHSNVISDVNFTASFNRREDEGYRKNDFNKRYIGHLKTGYKLSEKNSISLLFNTLHQYSGNFSYWKDLNHALEPPDKNLGETITSARYMAGLMSKNQLSSNVDLAVSGSYYKTIWTDETVSKNDVDADQYRGEVQMNYKASQNFLFINGIEMNYNTVTSNIYGNSDMTTMGIYTQGDYAFAFPLSITGGLRFDYNNANGFDNESPVSKKENAISPRLGMNYKLNEHIAFRTMASSGFRAPSMGERFASAYVSGLKVNPNPDLEAEKNFTVEGGMLFSSRYFNFDAAVFRNEFYDLIELAINMNDGTAKFDNIVRARIQGAELKLNPKLLDNIDINFGYTFMETEDLNKGTTLKYRPKHLFHSSAAFSYAGFETGLNFRYWSRVKEIDMEMINFGFIPGGDQRVDVYVLDLNFGYNFVYSGFPLRTYINVKNLLNYYYVEFIGNLAPIRNASLNVELFL
jgi:outer membrane receptor for ferrienterochelin and colicins